MQTVVFSALAAKLSPSSLGQVLSAGTVHGSQPPATASKMQNMWRVHLPSRKTDKLPLCQTDIYYEARYSLEALLVPQLPGSAQQLQVQAEP